MVRALLIPAALLVAGPAHAAEVTAAPACQPACGAGTYCYGGVCLPTCDPPCDEGAACYAGTCIGTCTPACRRGFVCDTGMCVPLRPLAPAPLPPRAQHAAPPAPLRGSSGRSQGRTPAQLAAGVPPRPRAAGTGTIVTGWVLVGVGLGLGSAFIATAANVEDTCLSSCPETEPLYAVGGVSLAVAVGGGVMAILGTQAKARRRDEIQAWDARYGGGGTAQIRVVPTLMPGGGGGVTVGGTL